MDERPFCVFKDTTKPNNEVIKNRTVIITLFRTYATFKFNLFPCCLAAASMVYNINARARARLLEFSAEMRAFELI